jgi:hypothetical protein
MAPLPATEPAKAETEDLLPRWMKSVISRKIEVMPALPFQRASKRHPGSLPAPRQRSVAIAAR